MLHASYVTHGFGRLDYHDQLLFGKGLSREQIDMLSVSCGALQRSETARRMTHEYSNNEVEIVSTRRQFPSARFFCYNSQEHQKKRRRNEGMNREEGTCELDSPSVVRRRCQCGKNFFSLYRPGNTQMP